MERNKTVNKNLYTILAKTGEIDLSSYNKTLLDKKIIIIKSNFHNEITLSVVFDFLNSLPDDLRNATGVIEVPGSFETPLVIKKILQKYNPDIILAVGCIIKGDTKHNEYLASTIINALNNLSLEFTTPIINGVLTTDNIQQAIDRAGKKYRKGCEFASNAELMINQLKKLDK
jgi:6,7-dimethyl-8-ribityllumazine synthase